MEHNTRASVLSNVTSTRSTRINHYFIHETLEKHDYNQLMQVAFVSDEAFERSCINDV